MRQSKARQLLEKQQQQQAEAQAAQDAAHTAPTRPVSPYYDTPAPYIAPHREEYYLEEDVGGRSGVFEERRPSAGSRRGSPGRVQGEQSGILKLTARRPTDTAEVHPSRHRPYHYHHHTFPQRLVSTATSPIPQQNTTPARPSSGRRKGNRDSDETKEEIQEEDEATLRELLMR